MAILDIPFPAFTAEFIASSFISTFPPSPTKEADISLIAVPKALHIEPNFSKSDSPMMSCKKPSLLGIALANLDIANPALAAASTDDGSILPLTSDEKSATAFPNDVSCVPKSEKLTPPPMNDVMLDNRLAAVNDINILANVSAALIDAGSTILTFSMKGKAFFMNPDN